jgi:hypothetical protein
MKRFSSLQLFEIKIFLTRDLYVTLFVKGNFWTPLCLIFEKQSSRYMSSWANHVARMKDMESTYILT